MANQANASTLLKRSACWLRLPLLTLAFAALPLTSHAVNLKFLDGSLLAQLSSDEIAALKQEVGAVLNKSPDKEIIHWTAQGSGIQVQIKPKLSFSEGDSECRRTLFKLSKGDVKPEYYRFDICRTDGQKWQVKDSLIRKLTDQDRKMMEGTLLEVLDSDKSNKVPASWSNPSSKNSGVMVPISYFTKTGSPCREVAISIINSNGGTMDGHYTFCKKGDVWERQ